MTLSIRSSHAVRRHLVRVAGALSIVVVLAGTTPNVVPARGAALVAIASTATTTNDPQAGRESEPPADRIARPLPRREYRVERT